MVLAAAVAVALLVLVLVLLLALVLVLVLLLVLAAVLVCVVSDYVERERARETAIPNWPSFKWPSFRLRNWYHSASTEANTRSTQMLRCPELRCVGASAL